MGHLMEPDEAGKRFRKLEKSMSYVLSRISLILRARLCRATPTSDTICVSSFAD